nr:PREDICTED: glycogen debranching enzyme [Tribolium castaneum]|eukprot:XP_015838644.1 PREDICTED: glycogen debranching enzyme [Tribolium castaneum]
MKMFSCLWKLYMGILHLILFFLSKSLAITFHLIRYGLLWCVLILLSLSRYLEQISGGRGEANDQDQNKEKSKKKAKPKPKKSPLREPSFSTTLTDPIEEVIEEILDEEVKSPKPRKRNKKSKPKSSDDEVGFSFFKSKSSESLPKFEENSTAKLSPEAVSDPPEDSLGFSFLPVRDKKQKKNQKVKIDDLPKSTLIEHFKHNKRAKNEFVVIEKVEVEDKPENCIEIVNKETGKKVYLEAKESKKVHSKISYASVASQRFEESLEQLRREEESKADSGVNGGSKRQVEEELATQIQGEERRLVDLLDQDHKPGGEIPEDSSFVEFNGGLVEEITAPIEETKTDPGEEILERAEEPKTAPGEEIVELIQSIVDTVNSETASSELLSEEISPFKMSSGTQVRVLTLNDKEHQDSTLYRLQKNWILQFRLGPSLLGRKVSLYCNYPQTGDFKRHSYALLKWQQDEGCQHSDDTALLTELTLEKSGSFHYFFTYDDQIEHQGSGFFHVDPVLKYGKNEKLPLDCIQCQTVLAKGLGPFDTWENKLQVAKESGYNMVHFTPIQELGASNSSYSLSEQLKINPLFTKQNGSETTFEDVSDLIKKMRQEWKVVSICDIVLNHTANESAWLKEHPEATYNCQNCPYLRPAYLLDAAFHQFSLDVSKGVYEDKGIPPQVSTEDHLHSIRYHLHNDVLSQLKIPELFICDVAKNTADFLNLIRNKIPTQIESKIEGELKLIQDPQFRRLASSIDMDLATKLYNNYRLDCYDEETRIKKCAEDFKNKLEALNKAMIDEVNEHLKVAVENVIAGIRYFRVQPDGPKVREISLKNPLVFRYFTDYGTPKSIKEHEAIMNSENGRFLMAHNGWVMNSDPLRNFAAPDSNVYIRRELIAWGDSVKLRYGEKPEDSPFLWGHMREYVELTARIFDGVRLDNCHSTPIPVAEYLLDCARKINPDLYVVAELFTNSDLTDNIFVNRLGISSLIREAMSAWDSHEQGRLVYRYGGSPVGSFYQPRIRPLVPSIAHALFLDLTHDNPSPVEKRSVFDLLPSTALVNMACCASGSNRGYDELVPHHVHVVDETRQYTEWTQNESLATGNARYITKKSGIIAAKQALNELHFHLGAQGFDQVYVDQMDPDVVAVTRHCPETHESYVLVAFTAFTHPPEGAEGHQRAIKPLRVEGVLDEIVLEATLNQTNPKCGSKYTKSQNHRKDNKWINGLSEYQVHLNQHIQASESETVEKVDSGSPNVVQLNFKNFKPGSVLVIKVSLPEDMREAIKNVRSLISQFSFKKGTELWKIISEMSLADLNRALYRCDQEERDEGHGFDTYEIPNFGRLVYAGFQGFMSLLSTIRPNNDLGHPMCANLRDGNWMIDYIWQRLKLDDGTKRLGQWFEENSKSLKSIPRYLVPCYFDVIVTGIYVLLFEQCYALMSDFVKLGSAFVKGLAMGSVQMAAYIKSADLPQLSPNLSAPKPPQRKNNKGELVQSCVTMSAGLPHFSVGYMRNWGRDTFIALRGLFLLTGRFEDARYHILGYAACLRHGLIPNLLDGGRNSRFNCRDAVWWWLHCIKCYTEDAPSGLSILQNKVSRIFPTDDSPPQPPGQFEQPLHAIMQEALNVHFQGLVFRERNAGRQIDEHMTDQGFNNQIGMLDKLSREGKYPYSGVERIGKNEVETKWTFGEWAEKIQNNFEKLFWVNETPVEGEIRPDLINKRGIYKDCCGASQEWTDFQLRCNFPVAMVVAPELFNPQHAWVALEQAEKSLLGPLGMRTLDPEDWAYNGDYDNSNDSDNFNVAHGMNYHQGPEWVWPVGFYLRARLRFAAANNQLARTVADTKVVLAKHFVELQTSTWRGLPELTNKNGAFCKDSSRTQAWSMSCILEVLYDLQRIERDQLTIN